MTIQQIAKRPQPSWEEVRASQLKALAAAPPDDSNLPILDALVAGGYLPMLRPCAPPCVPCTFRDKATGALVDKVSDGKVPATFRDGKWSGMKGWRETVPSPENVDQWRLWPDPNWCVVTGDVAALDIDVKIDTSEMGPEADRGRSLVAAVKDLTAKALGISVARLPMRWRDNSTSCMVLMRLAESRGKWPLQFVDAATDRKHIVEFLAKGQQIVVAGQHASGACVHSSLPTVPFDRLPVLDRAKLDELMSAIVEAAQKLGFHLISSKRFADGEATPPYSPSMAVLRAVMARRSDWVPLIIPCSVSPDREWRISSADLDRDLEEDLAIFPDGIHDYGTERTHTPASFIQEFGALGVEGDISIGGCPLYGPLAGHAFAPIGEPDPSVQRPTEAQALTWLCRQLAGERFPSLDEGATWKSALPTIARALGLNWERLREVQWFAFAEGDGPSTWGSEHSIEKADTLVALLAIDPDAFARAEFAHDLRSSGVDLRKIVDDRRAAVAAGLQEPETTAAPQTAGDDLPEPFDIFAQDDPVELSTLPVDCLPPILHRWVQSEARRKGAAESFAALAAVTAASVAVGASLRIQPRARDTDFTQPASLWAAIVAEPGRGKSPVISAAEKPLRELDAEWYAAGKGKHDRWSAAMQAHRKKPKENPDPGPEPVIRRIVVDDITLEQQVRVHAQNPRGLMRSPDELLGFFGSLGQYKKGAEGDRSQALRLFEGRPITVDRVGSGSVRADQALMGVIAGTQPQKLGEIARNLGADGMLQRFLFVIDDGAEREAIDEEPDAEALAAYRRALRRLAAIELPHPMPLKMVPDAQRIFQEASASIGRLRHVPASSVAWRGHLDKWGLFLPRIVLTFHALRYGFALEDVVFPAEIDAATVWRAVNFARFLLRHSLRLYQTFFAPDPAAAEARAIAGYLLTKPDRETVTPRNISDARKDLRSDRRKLFAAMAELEEAGWCAVEERSGDGPSRWRVNPKIHLRFEVHAERERAERSRKRQAIADAGEARKWINLDKMSDGGDGEH